MTMIRVFLISLLFALSACALRGSNVDSDRLTRLSRQTKANEQRDEENRFRNLITAERGKVKKMKEVLRPLPTVINEETLYTHVISAYNSRDLDGIGYYSDYFIKKFPKSVFADNAIYLKGQLNLEMGLPTDSLRDFENLVQNYPTSNKRAAALFGKGVCYRKLQIYKYAEKVFEELKKEYPKSPEFYKVELEEKLLRAEQAS